LKNLFLVKSLLIAALSVVCSLSSAVELDSFKIRIRKGEYHAPGSPGAVGTWARPDKDGYGSSYFRPVWFTIAQGSLTEIAFPFVDLLQTRDSFLAIKYNGKVYDERDGQHEVTRHPGSLSYHVKTVLPIAVIEKEFYVHPERDAVITDFDIQFNEDQNYEIIYQHNSAAANTPGGDYMFAESVGDEVTQLIALQGDVRGDEPAGLSVESQQFVNWSLKGGKAVVGYEGHSSPKVQCCRQWQCCRCFSAQLQG
jgi:Glucodextranase, domain N